jgi:hypothetical protein
MNQHMSFINKLRSKSKEEIFAKLNNILYGYIRKLLNFNFCRYFYISSFPESYTHFNSHQELQTLFKRFVYKNKSNNIHDINRLLSFILNIKQVLNDGVEGNFAELGVYKGNTAVVLAHYAKEYDRKVFLYDTFSGFNKKDVIAKDSKSSLKLFDDASVSSVLETLDRLASYCKIIEGYFPNSLTKDCDVNYSVVSLDCDLYLPMKAGLEYFWPRLSQGGIILIHDYSGECWPGIKLAVDEFCTVNQLYPILMPDRGGSAFIRK